MISRVAAGLAVVLVVVALAVVFVGGDGVHRYTILFQNAGQLVKDDDVQVGGRRIGSIREIELTQDNQARISVEVEEPYAPLHQGTRAVIRATSLSGVANRYIALTPGAQSQPELDDGAVLGTDRTTAIVDIDQLFNTFDDDTRQNLSTVIRSFAEQYSGRREEAGQAVRYFNPFLSTTRRLTQQLSADEEVLTDFLVNTSQAMRTIASRRDDLSSAIANTNQAATAIAAESRSLDEALRELPTTIRRGNTTFVNLRSTLGDLDRLVEESKPATRELAPFLRALRPLVADARPTIGALRAAVSSPGEANDLVDATLSLPPLERTARAALRNSTRALVRTDPVLAFYRPYTPDLAGWLMSFAHSTANYDASGHYARVAPVANVFRFEDDGAGGRLVFQGPDERIEQLDQGNLRRCPGAATQVATDGSNNWAAGLPEGGCDPSHVPGGP